MATISISQLDTATQAKVDDLYEVAVVDANSQTGYASRKLTAAQIATLIAQGIQFSGLSTEAKTIIASINEAAQNGGTEVEANPAGEPTDTLETIGIDGTIYGLGGSEPVSKTVTGNPISITDAADAPIVSGEILFAPKQDLHGYDKPWAGGAGDNIGEPVITSSQTISDIVFDTIEVDSNIFGTTISAGTVGASNVNQSLVQFTAQETTSYRIIGAMLDGTITDDFRTLLYDLTAAVPVASFITDNNFTINLTANHQYTISVFYKSGSTVTAQSLSIMVCKASTGITQFMPYSNICPIEGYTDCEVEVTGKNLLEVTATTHTNNGVIFTVNSDGSVVANGTATNWAVITLNYFTNSNPSIISLENGSNNIYMGGIFSGSEINTADGEANIPPAENVAINLVVSPGTTVNNVILYPMIRLATETDPTWEPYQSTPYTIDLDGTRYGGKVYPVTGKMPISMGHIASYNGEIIGEPWLSDRDEYVAGTTPSTGAEVVYTLATPLEVQLTPEQIRTLEGTNNISTNMTTMSLEYITQDYQPLVKLIERSAGHHYSTQERVVGTWIDGKPIYEKTFDVGYLLNNSIKHVSHGILNLKNVISIIGGGKTDSGIMFPIIYSHPDNVSSGVAVTVDSTNIDLTTKTDRTTWYVYLTIQYTKTTD